MITMDKLVALAKRRGFVYPGSEIYGGLANTYDYGPLGAELLRNIKNLWWETFITKRDDIVAIDASLISHQKIWEASGHTSGFSDAMVDCKSCKSRYRADHLIEEFTGQNSEGLNENELKEIIEKSKIKCPNCKKFIWTDVRKFNLLFPLKLGILEGQESLAYLRGETAQGIFINFKNVVDTTRVKLPFGIGQLGKSFRNEITLGNSVFRTIEFEQGEIEYFFDPATDNWEKLFENWKKEMWSFITNDIGISKKNLRWRVHTDKERSFYSTRTEDLEYKFPFGFKELWGLAYRTNYDLKRHSEYSRQDLSIQDPQTGQKITPHVIEPAVGINRIFLMVLADSYMEDKDRVVLKINPKLAPYKAAVFPLLANKPDLVEKAHKLYDSLKNDFKIYWDDRGNIGKRYLTQDEIGTPFCFTVDFESLENGTVTIRSRDTKLQKRIKIDEVKNEIANNL